MQMRWHWPPENWWGRRPTRGLGVEPDGLERLATTLRCSSAGAPLPDLQRLAPRCRRPCGAGSATRSGPGRSSASRARSCAQARPSSAGEVLAVEDDRARGRAGQLHEGPAGGRLAAAGLADEPEGLAARTSRLTSETAWTFSPVEPTGNSTTRFSARSRASPASRRCAVPLPAISDLLAVRRRERVGVGVAPWPAVGDRPVRASASRPSGVPTGNQHAVEVAGGLGLGPAVAPPRGTCPGRTGSAARSCSPSAG